MWKTRIQGLPSWFAFANILSASDANDYSVDADLALPFDASVLKNFPLLVGADQTARGSEFAPGTLSSWTRVANRGAWWAGPAGEQSRQTRDVIGSEAPAEASAGAGSATDPSVAIANGATITIDGPSAQSVTFAGTTGALKLEDPQVFTGVISGLSGADAIDLSGFTYGANVTATYLGNASGGTLTVTDGAETARIALSGDYLSSTWTLSSDGKGGTVVVDPTTSTNWQDLMVGGGGYVRGLDIAPNGTMVARTDSNGAYLWNGSAWVQLVTASSMPAAFDFTGGGVYEIQIADEQYKHLVHAI